MGTDRRGRVDAEPRYCSNCGDDLEPSMNYCPNCGTRIRRRASDSRTSATGRSGRSGRSERSRGTGSGSGPRRSAPETRSDSRSDPRSTNRNRNRNRNQNRDRDRNRNRDRAREQDRNRDRNRLEAKIAKATSEGWRLEHDFGDHVVMVRRSFGDADVHLVIALATIWWTMGLGNVLYGVYKYVEDAERMVLRPELADDAAAEESASESHLLARATAATCWLASAVLALIGAQLLGSGAATALVVLFGLALVFGLLGLGVLPSVADRLERRHSVTTNGRTRSVDERSVVSYDQPCTACADPIGRGVERVYRSEFCLLGLPITGTEGRNYYCRRCANAERSPVGPVASDRSGRDTGRRANATERTRNPGADRATDADGTEELEPDSAGLD